MAKAGNKETRKRVSRWFSRLSDANKAHDNWSKSFKVQKSKRYIKGKQREGEDILDSHNQERIIVNLILPTIAVRIPSLMYYFPFCRIQAAPHVSALDGTNLEDRVQLLQDVANTIIRDPRTNFRRETLMSLKQAMYGFGLAEIGYSADFVDNPYYQKPALEENENVAEENEDAQSVDTQTLGNEPTTFSNQPKGMPPDDMANLKQLVDEEQYYVRHIPPEQFRVSISSQPFLEANDWCGYFEWMYVEDVKKATAYDSEVTKDLKAGGDINRDLSTSSNDISTTSQWATSYPYDSAGDKDRDRSGQVKVWKIWDIRQKKRYVLAEGCDKFLIDGEAYNLLPLFPLTFEDQDDDFYPIPPVYSMLGIQDEYNDAREMQRNLRKIIYPRFVADGGIDPDELRKLEDGGPGVIAHVQQANPCPVVPLQQPELDAQIIRALSVSQDELFQVSGVGGEQRGQADSDTATQANIINQRSQIRDSYSRLRVAEWLGAIIRGLVQLSIDNMSLPMWILRCVDPQSTNFMVDAMNISSLYRQITLTDLQEADQLLRWDVSVDVETLSPLSEDTLRAQIQNIVTMLSQPPVAMLLHNSPPLLKTVLDRFGIRSAKDQESIRMALGIVATTPTEGGGVPSQPNSGPGPSPQLGPSPQGVQNPSQQMPAPGTQGLQMQRPNALPGPSPIPGNGPSTPPAPMGGPR